MEFLIFGSIWFWSLFGLFSFLILMTLIFSERDGWIWMFGLFLAILFFLGGGLDFAWMADNPLLVLRNVGIYLGIGLLWSMKEWYSFVKERIEYQLQFQSSSATYEQKKKYISENAPYIAQHWTKVANWITYWPYYILAWALTDPIRRLAQQFRIVYSKITQVQINSALRKIDKASK